MQYITTHTMQDDTMLGAHILPNDVITFRLVANENTPDDNAIVLVSEHTDNSKNLYVRRLRHTDDGAVVQKLWQGGKVQTEPVSDHLQVIGEFVQLIRPVRHK